MADAWNNHENSVLVEAYMRLVESMIDGEPIVKTRLYRQVADQTSRGAKSVEFRMLNVSGVLVSLGYGFPHGLAPAKNFQASLVDVVRRELARFPHVAEYLAGDRALHNVTTGGVSAVEAREGDDVARGNPSPSDVAALTSGDGAIAAGGSAQVVSAPTVASGAADELQVTSLWELATGGTEVAASPDKPPSAFRGPSPAAVDEAMTWMREGMAYGSDNRRMLFLVGGPGGGKSFVASTLTSGLKELTSQDDGLAHRSYRFQAPGGTVRVINDATIPPADRADPGQIASELDASREDFVIACVNRGVLVDETAQEAPGQVGSAITSWLRHGRGEDAVGSGISGVQPVGTARSFLKQGVVADGHERGRIDVLALYVDVCSLIEERPQTELQAGVLRAQPYEVQVFEPGQDRSGTPAGLLVAAVAESLSWASRGPWDPVAANISSLSSSAVQSGLLSVLRGAELASSQLLSYRELWGAISRTVAGPLPELIARESLAQWLEAHGVDAEGSGAPDFPSMRTLASVRLHESLFAEDRVGRHPVLRATTSVDPARDMVPGQPESEGLGWASPVMEAFAGAELGASPLERLRASTGTVALDGMVTVFDELLDDAYVRWNAVEADVKARSEASSWYGRYLSRLLALAHGYPAFAAEIRSWTRARSLSPGLPPDLERALTTLVSPRRDPDEINSKSLIPLFASRTEPLRGRTAEPTLSVVVEDVGFRTSVDGEKVLLHLTEGVQPLGEVVLDLDLIREAMATSEGWTGMTDVTDSTEPRLERFRSLRLIPENRGTGDLRIAGPMGDTALTTKEQK